MVKRIAILACAVFLSVNLCGCLAIFAGGAAGGGTAVWLSNKLTQQFNAGYERTIRASEKALESLKLPITKETKEKKITQLRSVQADGRDIWIDVSRISENSTQVDVRVGIVSPDKETASNILKRIQGYL